MLSQYFTSEISNEEFASLRGMWVVRIATHPLLVRKGYGEAWLGQLLGCFEGKIVGAEEYDSNQAAVSFTQPISKIRPPTLDYIGISFGPTTPLLRFRGKTGSAPVWSKHLRNASPGKGNSVTSAYNLLLTNNSNSGTTGTTPTNLLLTAKQQAKISSAIQSKVFFQKGQPMSFESIVGRARKLKGRMMSLLHWASRTVRLYGGVNGSEGGESPRRSPKNSPKGARGRDKGTGKGGNDSNSQNLPLKDTCHPLHCASAICKYELFSAESAPRQLDARKQREIELEETAVLLPLLHLELQRDFESEESEDTTGSAGRLLNFATLMKKIVGDVCTYQARMVEEKAESEGENSGKDRLKGEETGKCNT